MGTSLGNLYIFETRTKMVRPLSVPPASASRSHGRQLLHTERIIGNNAIKSLEFDRRGTSLVLNSADRVLRVYTLVPPSPAPGASNPASSQPSPSRPRPADDTSEEPSSPSGKKGQAHPSIPTMVLDHKFLDQIARSPWKTCAFSKNSEYVIGGAGHKESHQIFIWDRETGALTKILEGRTDPLEDCDVRSVLPCLCYLAEVQIRDGSGTPSDQSWRPSRTSASSTYG